MILIVFSLSLVYLPVSAATSDVFAGDIIKTENSSTVYYIGDDSKRHIFPNARIYNSWYSNYSQVKTVQLSSLQQYPLSSVNVTYKPGAKLVKITTDPKVYAVGAGGVLHWVKSEVLAKNIYGTDWNKKVEDLPDQFFANYEIGDEIDKASDYDPGEQEESAPEIRHNLVDLLTTQPVVSLASFDGIYDITYDLSAVEVAIGGAKATLSVDSIGSGGAQVGSIDIPAEIADSINETLSHQIEMDIAGEKILGVHKITMINQDLDGESVDGLYAERSQNYVFGKLSSVDPPTNNCGALGGTLISGHFVEDGIELGKTTIGFVAGCKAVLVAARATVSWTAVKVGVAAEPPVVIQ